MIRRSALITSKDNPSVKYAASLVTKKAREREGRFLIEGVKLVAEALLKPDMVEQVFFSFANGLDEVRGLGQFQGLVTEIDLRLGRMLSDTETPQGVWAICRKPLMEVVSPASALFIAALQDPGNLGTILRTALAFGIEAVYLSSGTVDPYSPKVIRAAMGATIHLPMMCEAGTEALMALKERGHKILAAEPRGGVDVRDADWGEQTVIIIGNEGQGIPQMYQNLADCRLRIPLQAGVESLNAAVAAGIILYAFSRRKPA